MKKKTTQTEDNQRVIHNIPNHHKCNSSRTVSKLQQKNMHCTLHWLHFTL